MQLDNDESIKASTDLAQLWHRLLDGQLFVADTFCADGRCFGVVERASGTQVARARGVKILERVFEGESQKSLAFELGVSVATIACHSANALCAVVRRHRVSRAPVLLVMAAFAAHGLELGPARLDEVRADGRWVISVQVPGETFRDRLSPSEWAVTQLAIEGEAHTRIASRRGTAIRTVANQLAAAFEKLGASGRSALRAKAIREYADQLLRQSAPACAVSPLPLPPQPPPAARWPEQQLAAYG